MMLILVTKYYWSIFCCCVLMEFLVDFIMVIGGNCRKHCSWVWPYSIESLPSIRLQSIQWVNFNLMSSERKYFETWLGKHWNDLWHEHEKRMTKSGQIVYVTSGHSKKEWNGLAQQTIFRSNHKISKGNRNKT